MKFTFSTTDKETARNILMADKMQIAISSYYGEVLRNYVKYKDMSAESHEIVQEITEKLGEHFKDVKFDE